VVDDLIVGRVDDDLRLVVNAACRSSDLEHLSGALGPSTVTPLDEYALIAVQGPRAAEILAPLVTDPLPARFMDIRRAQFGRVDIVIARSGYTGEDGFEISLPAESAEALVTSLEDHPDARLIGLGARDSLRLEAGLCLYGHELDETTTPIEAGLGWVIDGVRRRGGARAGGFPGADVIFEQMDTGVARRRVGLQPTGRAPIRAGAMLFDNDGTAVGRVTSGGFGASVGKAIAMGYVAESSALIGLRLFAEVRGRRHEVDVVRLPFVPLNYEY
jgi:aminomethyltransferase